MISSLVLSNMEILLVRLVVEQVICKSILSKTLILLTAAKLVFLANEANTAVLAIHDKRR